MNKKEKVDKILSRGIIKEIFPSKKAFKEALLGEKQLKFYIGADTTGDSLHLSHAKNFMLLEEFRQLGHKVYVLFGDLTACIGDPSDKDSTRDNLTRKDAVKNAKSWIKQIKKIINFDDKKNPAEIRFNSEWFDKFSITDTLELLSNATVQQMLERDMFVKRMKENKPIFLHEFLYPMFQGYDSVALDVDVELCGTDQIFNALNGRSLMKKIKNKNKFVVVVNLMENPKTGSLMSKTTGTGIFLGTDAKIMFGEIMSQPDEMIKLLLINNTRISLDEIKALNIENKPRDAKLFTAKTIVTTFYGEEDALKAQEAFINTFSNKGFPKDAPIVKISDKNLSLLDLLVQCDKKLSKSELRRLINQNSISINRKKHSNEKELIKIDKDLEIQIGKKKWFKVKI